MTALSDIMVEHEQPNGRRQGVIMTLSIYPRHLPGQRQVTATGDGLQTGPRVIFKADARLVPIDDDRTL
jgi:hypothetical protein